jgi:hypothetical protein
LSRIQRPNADFTAGKASLPSKLLDKSRLREASLSTAAVIDGLWLRKAVGHEIDRDEAVALVLRNLASLLSADEIVALRQRHGRGA